MRSAELDGSQEKRDRRVNTVKTRLLEPSKCRRYLFTSSGDSGIWVPDLVALVQNDIVPVVALQDVLEVPHGGVRRDENAVT